MMEQGLLRQVDRACTEDPAQACTATKKKSPEGMSGYEGPGRVRWPGALRDWTGLVPKFQRGLVPLLREGDKKL